MAAQSLVTPGPAPEFMVPSSESEVPIKQLLCDEKIFTVDGVFSESECQDIIDIAEAKGFKKSSPSGGGHGRTGREDPRTSEFSIRNDQKLAAMIWQRVKEWLPPDVSHVSTTAYINSEQVAWRPVSVNPHIRIYRYNVGQTFPEHIDYKMQRKVVRDGKQYRQLTFMTVLIYLNQDFTGGCTGFWTRHDEIGVKEHCRFLRASENKPHQVVVAPKTGRVLINDQNLLHEGMAPTKGTKYVLRTDIIHERNFPIHPKVLKTLSPEELADREEPWETLFETSCKNYAD